MFELPRARVSALADRRDVLRFVLEAQASTLSLESRIRD
jgi:hypothetical protein